MDNKNLPSIPTDDQLKNLIPNEDKEIAKDLPGDMGGQYLYACMGILQSRYYWEYTVKQYQQEINKARSMQVLSEKQFDKQKQDILETAKTIRSLESTNKGLSNELEIAKGCQKYGPKYREYYNTPTLRISLCEIRRIINVKYKSIYPENRVWEYHQLYEILHANKLIVEAKRGYKVGEKGRGLISCSKDPRKFMVDFKLYMNLMDVLEKNNYRYLRDGYESIVNK